MQFAQGRVRTARHLGQGAFLRAGCQAGRGSARVGFSSDSATQALALLEFGYEAHADTELSGYLSLGAVRQGGRSGHPFA